MLSARRRNALLFVLGALGAGLSAAAGCAAGNAGDTAGVGGTADATGAGGGSTSTTSTGGTGGGTGGGDFDGGPTGSGGAGGSEGLPALYAHTDSTLYQLDPANGFAITTLGDFDCVGGAGQDIAMTDFAVDKAQTLWGISATAVHPLTVKNGVTHCGTPTPLDNPKGVKFYGLTYAPVGVLDPNEEVLVGGNTAGELWAIDGQGKLTQHGTFGKVPSNDGNGHSYANAGKAWELSGDIVFLANDGNPIGYATVRDCPNPPYASNCNPVNTLIEINVGQMAQATTGSVTKSVRGLIVKRPGCNDGTNGDYGNMYGVTALGDKVYGFSRGGNIVEIDVSDGTACLVKAFPADKFAGAGVTTLAKVEPPPPK
jgi:hypothetical protein